VNWQLLELSLSADDLPRVETLLRLAGTQAISLNDAAGAEILEPAPGTTPLWPEIRVRALFPEGSNADATRRALESAFQSSNPIRVRQLDNDEWKGTWAQRPTTQLIGEGLVLLAAEEEWAGPFRAAVKLNLGLAFGTGDHPTTALCLEWLDPNLEPGTRLLDYGCGSGILAIAALRLGAATASAVDIDPQALLATRENADLNDVASQLWISLPDELPEAESDVLVANILAGPLQDLATRFRELVSPGGRIVLSGILAG
jgi:ribosomal protein L11 methyltransferase